jgi:DUF1680 family protein
MSATRVTSDFWFDRQVLNRQSSIPAVIKTFEDTGRIRALTQELAADEKHHIFWESDLAKWLEAVFIHLQQNPDDELNQYAEELVDKIIANQESDGYLNAYFSFYEPENRFTNLKIRHELYCAGHLLEAAVEHSKLHGSSRFFEAMEKYMDYIATQFGPELDKTKGYPGHQEIELALIKAYEHTDKIKFLNLAHYFIDERGREPHYFDHEEQLLAKSEKPIDYSDFPSEIRDFVRWHLSDHARGHSYFQAHVPPVEQTTAEGHSVRALYMFTAMADLARLRNDAPMLATCKTLWRNIVDRRMYVHGGVGSAHHGERFSFDFDLPNDMAYAETCASIALMFFAERLSRIERNSEYADIIERALYNTVLASTSANGRGFFYDNYLECNPGFLEFQKRRHGIRDEYHTCSCCPPNVLRLIADLGRYVYSESSEGIEVHQFISASRQFSVDQHKVTVRQSSGLPWEGRAKLQFEGTAGKTFTLFIRVPDWDQHMHIKINGDAQQYETKDGYASFERPWTDDDVIDLEFDLSPRLVRSNAHVRYNIRRTAVFCGPILYCLEAPDNSVELNNIILPDQPSFEGSVNNTLAPGCRTLSVSATCVQSDSDQLYTTASPARSPVTATFIPYFLWANRGEHEMLVWVNEADT